MNNIFLPIAAHEIAVFFIWRSYSNSCDALFALIVYNDNEIPKQKLLWILPLILHVKLTKHILKTSKP